MDMSKYRGMFLSETKEHLKSMGRQIITLEKSPSDREGIDALFRNAHSIKGMAASMGYDQTARLAHCLEDLMDEFRQSGTVPISAVDRLLSGIDLLEGLLEDIEQEKAERNVESFIRQGEEGPPSDGNPPATTSEPVPQPPPAAEALQLVIVLSPEAAAPTARALLIFRQLEQIGELVYRSPSQEEISSGAKAYRLQAHLKTDMDADGVQAALSAMADVASVTIGRPAPVQATGGEPSALGRKEETTRTVRVRTELLDQFINITGELLTNRYMLQNAVNQERWPTVQEGLGQLARLVTDLHNHVLQVRMLPLESIAGRLPRLVRDLARKSDKEISLHIKGEEIELDRAILEQLADPLVHMVRNAIDHGIEKIGCVSVHAWREKDLVLIEVVDDGRGMDPMAIRQKALEKQLITPQQAKTLRDRDALQLVCLPGFSTAGAITETSGRGVGMDVVKNAVEALGGTLHIESKPGQGSRILLKLPLSVAIIRILLVEVDGNQVGMPITRVFRTIDVDRGQIKSSGKQLVIRFEEEIIPLLSLRKILQLPVRSHTDSLPVVITEFRGRKVGLVVDRLLGQRETFVKSLAFPLDNLTGVSGATFLGDGSVVFIVDPQSLIEGNLYAPRPTATGASR
jgi:two-component system chemotaxis sensor kinase CheA